MALGETFKYFPVSLSAISSAKSKVRSGVAYICYLLVADDATPMFPGSGNSLKA